MRPHQHRQPQEPSGIPVPQLRPHSTRRHQRCPQHPRQPTSQPEDIGGSGASASSEPHQPAHTGRGSRLTHGYPGSPARKGGEDVTRTIPMDACCSLRWHALSCRRTPRNRPCSPPSRTDQTAGVLLSPKLATLSVPRARSCEPPSCLWLQRYQALWCGSGGAPHPSCLILTCTACTFGGEETKTP